MKNAKTVKSLAAVLPLTLFCGALFAEQAEDISLKHAQTLVHDKHYEDALDVLNKLMNTAGADRYAILMLKGEAQMQLEDVAMTTAAFSAAAKEAKDQPQKAAAYALEVLVRRSNRFEFTPKGNPERSYEIRNPKQRKDALAALFSDELALMQKRLDQIKTATTPLAVAEFGTALTQLALLEIAANGNTEITSAMGAPAGNQFTTVTDKSLTTSEGRIDTYTTNANKTTTVQVDILNQQTGKMQKTQQVRRVGPTDTEIAQLKAMTRDLDKLNTLLSDMAAPLAIKQETLRPFIDRIANDKRNIDLILNTDYTKPFNPNQPGANRNPNQNGNQNNNQNQPRQGPRQGRPKQDVPLTPTTPGAAPATPF